MGHWVYTLGKYFWMRALYHTKIFCDLLTVILADLSSQNTKMENSMGSSFDRSDSISDDDEAQDVFVLPEEDSEVENAKELNNIKRILNECRVLYKSKVDHHNRKVFILQTKLMFIYTVNHWFPAFPRNF